MEIAIYGGTFNPPTRAHEAIVEACLREPFDEVWVMPSGERADKSWDTCDEDRMAMLGLMKQARFRDSERLRVSIYEMAQEGRTETWRTARSLAERRPNDTFWFVFGADSYIEMPKWHNGEWFRDTFNQLIVPRQGFDLPEPHKRLRHLAVQLPENPISSTDVRKAVAERRSLDNLVSAEVANFIATRGLYRCATMR